MMKTLFLSNLTLLAKTFLIFVTSQKLLHRLPFAVFPVERGFMIYLQVNRFIDFLCRVRKILFVPFVFFCVQLPPFYNCSLIACLFPLYLGTLFNLLLNLLDLAGVERAFTRDSVQFIKYDSIRFGILHVITEKLSAEFVDLFADLLFNDVDVIDF